MQYVHRNAGLKSIGLRNVCMYVFIFIMYVCNTNFSFTLKQEHYKIE